MKKLLGSKTPGRTRLGDLHGSPVGETALAHVVGGAEERPVGATSTCDNGRGGYFDDDSVTIWLTEF